MMDLKIDFPIPMFIGTPVPVKLSNLEPPGKPKLTMPVPVGSKNVALGKTVTSSDPEPTIGDLDFVTDGDKDGGDGYFVELGFDTQWVQIDLEKEFDIHAVVVWHFHKAACAYYDVVVQVSNDPEFKEATTIYNSDDDNSSGLGVGKDMAYIETNHGRIIDAKGTKGRYVRLYSNGNTQNDLNHYIEVEVHATE
ncbi:MAG: discoidin domain-containing protein [Verrucomicrobiae bacterium]|nr:discoidin domain-containing protein [Verrucomicrobiae bacterium]